MAYLLLQISMYIHKSSSFLYSAQDESSLPLKTSSKASEESSEQRLKNFSEKANLSFDELSLEMDSKEKNEAIEALNSIGKAAAFSAAKGYDSLEEKQVVSQYFGNFSGVLSDEEIQKMIYAKLNSPRTQNREFLEKFAKALDEPLRHINIRV